MADIENPIGLEKGQDVQGTKPAESGAIPAGVLEKAKEYGVQPGQWQQYGQHMQDEYNRIVSNIMTEYKLLDQVEQERIIRALESGDDHALDEVLLMVDAHLKGQDKELPHVLNNLKKVAAKKILELAADGKLSNPVPATQSSTQDDPLHPVVEVIVTLYQTLNAPDQQTIFKQIASGDMSGIENLIVKLEQFGYKPQELDRKRLYPRIIERLSTMQ